MVEMVKNLYSYRELLKTNISKEIRGKYKGAWLGILWSFLNPLLMLLVYSIIFPMILRIEIENYALFLIIALMPWNWFTLSVQTGAGCVVNNENILKKIFFPREILPISIVTSGAVNFLISCLIMLIFILFSGIGFSWHVILFPLIFIVEYLLILGFTFITSACTVYVRDLEHVISVLMLVMFYATPIVYTIDMIPESFRWVLELNPLTHILEAFRDIFYYQQLPDLSSLFILGAISFFLVWIGHKIFKKLERNFAEEL